MIKNTYKNPAVLVKHKVETQLSCHFLLKTSQVHNSLFNFILLYEKKFSIFIANANGKQMSDVQAP